MSELPLLLRLDNVDSLPDGGPVTYEVERRGLDIGRDAYLDWTLPDAERFISGKHCEIRYRDGGYWLHDVSTNGTQVNGRTGRLTQPHRLEDGDRIHIGHYIVAVELHGEDAAPAPAAPATPAGTGASDDPWGGVGDTAAAVDRRDFANHAGARPGPGGAGGGADLAEENISWGVGDVSQGAPATDDDIWGAPRPAGGGAAAADDWGWTPPAAQGGGAGRSDAIDPDWRAELARHRPEQKPAVQRPAESTPPPQAPAREASAPAAAPAEESAAEPPAPEKPEPDPAPFAEAPPATAPSSPPPSAEAPARASDRPAPQADPFAEAADNAGPSGAAEVRADSAPPPEFEPSAPQPDPFSDGSSDVSSPAPEPAEPVSPSGPTAPEPSVEAPSAPPQGASPARPPAGAAPSGLASRWTGGDAEAQESPPQPQSRPQPAPAGQGGDFIAAFERGAGLPAGAVTDLAGEALAEELGGLFKLVTQNLQAMLAARAETKSAMRSSDRTMIGAMENNPLKFSPTPEDAMRIMFGAKSRSYLDARKTLESSFADLQKHQMQTFGAMQQALQALIEDLDPKSIEEATAKDGGLAGIVGSRRAKYWDTYVERFRAKSGRHERGMIDAFMILFAEMYDRQR